MNDAEFNRRYRYVKLGYVLTAVLFLLALLCFIGGIATGLGAIAGIGGIVMIPTIVTIIVTATYHNLSGVFNEQHRRQR